MSDDLARTLMVHLIRKGDLTLDNITEMADALEEAGHESAAHLCRMTFFEAIAPTEAEWEVGQRRSQMRIVAGTGHNPP